MRATKRSTRNAAESRDCQAWCEAPAVPWVIVAERAGRLLQYAGLGTDLVQDSWHTYE